MAEKSNRPVNIKDLTEDEKLKYEIAEELGLLDQVMAEGWMWAVWVHGFYIEIIQRVLQERS